MNSVSDIVVYVLFAIFVVLIALVLLVQLVVRTIRFGRELSYLNGEIKRTEGRERKYWIKKRRKLWRAYLLFFPHI